MRIYVEVKEDRGYGPTLGDAHLDELEPVFNAFLDYVDVDLKEQTKDALENLLAEVTEALKEKHDKRRASEGSSSGS